MSFLKKKKKKKKKKKQVIETHAMRLRNEATYQKKYQIPM